VPDHLAAGTHENPLNRHVGESYKDYADRMAGHARACQLDRDRALARLAAVGRCGDHCPTVLPTNGTIICALPARHEGWHRSDEGTEWNRSPEETPRG
jgi:hypothetical protein